MRHIRHYVDMPLAVDTRLSLPEAAFAHLIRVLRLGVGDTCVLFNGDGFDYQTQLVLVEKKTAQVEIISCREVNNESPLRITLAQSLVRGEKMDWILQKATELGAACIVPIVTERTSIKLDAERSDKKMQHWRGVLTSACEQCGRAQLPQILEPQSLAEFIVADRSQQRFILDPEARQTLTEANVTTDQSLTLVIGPEGGLSEQDLTLLRIGGFEGLKLGPRIFRTETAGLAAIAALQALYGDWR